MSTDKVKASPFNPVDHMETDEEIIEFIVDCYNEDPEGRSSQATTSPVSELMLS